MVSGWFGAIHLINVDVPEEKNSAYTTPSWEKNNRTYHAFGAYANSVRNIPAFRPFLWLGL